MSQQGHNPQFPRKRAPIMGMNADALKVYALRPRRDYVREPMTIMEGMARWLDGIDWVIDAPFPDTAIGPDHVAGQRSMEELPLHRLNIKEPGIVAEYLKNVFWGLTFADVFQETNAEGSLVGFLSDGGTISLRSRAKSLQQMAVVRVLVDSVRPRYAMDVAMRLWNLFRERPGFSVFSTRLNPITGTRVQVRQPDFHVRQALVLDEPTYLAVGAGEERSQVTFRLQVTYVRH